MTGWDGVLCCMLVCQSVCVLICQWSRPSLGHWSYQAQCLATRATSTGATIGSRLVSLTASQVMWMNLSLSAGPIRAGHKIHQPMGTADWWGSACMAVLADRRAVRQLSASVCSEEHDFFNPENTVTSCTLSPTQAPLSPGVATTSNLQTEERFSMLPTLVKWSKQYSCTRTQTSIASAAAVSLVADAAGLKHPLLSLSLDVKG